MTHTSSTPPGGRTHGLDLGALPLFHPASGEAHRLRIPFSLQVSAFKSPDDLNAMLDRITAVLSAEYFWGKDLCLERLADYVTRAAEPLTHLPSPVIRVVGNNKGVLRLTPAPQVSPGDTVYAPDQLAYLLRQIEQAVGQWQGLHNGVYEVPAAPALGLDESRPQSRLERPSR